jgi:hypothetical protein
MTDTLQQIDLNDAEKAVEWAERRMEDVARIPTRTARMLLKFAVIGTSPADLESTQERLIRLEADLESEFDKVGGLEEENRNLTNQIELANKRIADLVAVSNGGKG